MYYIYHIKGVKIGVSTKPENRVANQGYSEFEILEQHTDIHKVSDREIELQKQYGYPVDTLLYYEMCKRSKNGGLSTPKEQYSEMGRKSKPSKHQIQNILKHAKRKRKLTYTDAQQIRADYKLGAFNYTQLAKMYGVSHVAISNIIKNKTYVTP